MCASACNELVRGKKWMAALQEKEDEEEEEKEEEEEERERKEAGDCEGGAWEGGGDAVSARTRTHAHVRTCAHRHTFKSIYICIYV